MEFYLSYPKDDVMYGLTKAATGLDPLAKHQEDPHAIMQNLVKSLKTVFHVFKAFPEMVFIFPDVTPSVRHLFSSRLKFSVITDSKEPAWFKHWAKEMAPHAHITWAKHRAGFADATEDGVPVGLPYTMDNDHKPLETLTEMEREKVIPFTMGLLTLYIADLLEQQPQLVEQEIREKVYRKGGKKYRYKTKKVCFLRTGQSKKVYQTLTKNGIVSGTPHNHRYDVAGHWRKIKGVGKDWNGEYGQVGRTWVKNCIKGKGEYIYKPRVIQI